MTQHRKLKLQVKPQDSIFEPHRFFGWLGGVGTAIAVLLPLVLSQDLAARLATATVNLVLGLAIIGLVRSTAAASLRPEGSAKLSRTLRMLRDEG